MVTSFASVLPTHVPHTIPALSTDALIVLAVALVFVYGVIAGYAALVRESISVYVGLVLANNFGKPAYDYISHSGGHGFPVNQTDVQLLLLILPIVLLQFTRRHHGHASHKHGMIVVLLLAFLTSMLVISSVLSQLSYITLAQTLGNSNLASWIYNLRLGWLAAVPIGIAIGAIFHPKQRHH